MITILLWKEITTFNFKIIKKRRILKQKRIFESLRWVYIYIVPKDSEIY